MQEIVPFLGNTDSDRFEELFHRLPLNVQREKPDFVSAIRPHYFSNVASKEMEAVDQYLDQLFDHDKLKIAAFVEGVMNEDEHSEMSERNFLTAVRATLPKEEVMSKQVRKQVRTQVRTQVEKYPTEGELSDTGGRWSNHNWSGKYVPREFSFGPYLAAYRQLMEAFPVEQDVLQYEPVLKTDHRLRIADKLYSARRNSYDMQEHIQQIQQTIRTAKEELAKAKTEEERGKILRRIKTAIADVSRDSDEEHRVYDEYSNPVFEIIQPVDFTMEDVARWLLDSKQTDILKSIAIRNKDIQLDILLNLIDVGALAPDFNKSEQTVAQKKMVAGYSEKKMEDEKKGKDEDEDEKKDEEDQDEDQDEAPINRLIDDERNRIFQRILDLEQGNIVPDNEEQRMNLDHELNNLKKLHQAYSELQPENMEIEFVEQSRDVRKQKEMYVKELSSSDAREDVDQFLNHFLNPSHDETDNKAYEKTEFRLRRLWQTLANLVRETDMKRGLMKTLLSSPESTLRTLDINLKKSQEQSVVQSLERHKNGIKMYIGAKILTMLRKGINVVNLGGVNLSNETAYQVLDALLIMDNLNENVPALIGRRRDFQLNLSQAEKVFPFIAQTYTRFASEGIPKTGWVPLIILENSFETHALNKSIVQVVDDVYENIVSLVRRWVETFDQLQEDVEKKDVEKKDGKKDGKDLTWIKRLLNNGNYEFFLLDEILNGELGLEFAMQSFVKRNMPKRSDTSVDQRQAKAYLNVLRAIRNTSNDIVLAPEHAIKEYLLADGRTLRTDDDKFVLSDKEREYWKKYGALGLTGDYEQDPRWTKQDEERWQPIVERFRASPEYQHYLDVKRGYIYPTLKDFVIANSNADVIVSDSNQVHRFQFEHLVHDAYYLARDAYLDTNVWQPLLVDMENFLYQLIGNGDANMGWRHAREDYPTSQTSMDELVKRVRDRSAELKKMRQDGRSDTDIDQRRRELDEEINALKSDSIPTIQQLKQRIDHLRRHNLSEEELEVLSEELKNARSPDTYVDTVDPFWKWLVKNYKLPRVFSRLMTSIVWDNFLNLFQQAQQQSRVDMRSTYTKSSNMINNPDVLDGIEPFVQQRVRKLTEKNFYGPISREMAQSVVQQLGPTIKADVEEYIRSRPLLVKDGLDIESVGDFFFSRGFLGAPPLPLVVAKSVKKNEFSTQGMDVAEFNDSNLLGWKNTRFSFDVQAPSMFKKKNSDFTAVSKLITHLTRIPEPTPTQQTPRSQQLLPKPSLRPSQLFANRQLLEHLLEDDKPKLKKLMTQGDPPIRYRSLFDFVYRNLTLYFAQKLLSVNGLSFDPAKLLVSFAMGGVGWETREYENYQHYLKEFVFHSVSQECKNVVAKKFELPKKYMLAQLLVSTGTVPIVYTDKEDNILGQVNGMESYDVFGRAMVSVREKCIDTLRKKEDQQRASQLKTLTAKLPFTLLHKTQEEKSAIIRKANALRKQAMLSAEDEETIRWASHLRRVWMLSTPINDEEIIQNARLMVAGGLLIEPPFDKNCVTEKGRELIYILHQFSRDVTKTDLDLATARFIINTLYLKCGVNSQQDAVVPEMSAEWRHAMLSYSNFVGMNARLVDGAILSLIWKYVYKYCKAIADENDLPVNERIHATEQEIEEINHKYPENLEVFPLFDELPQIGTDQMKKLFRYTLEDYLNYEGLRQMRQEGAMFLHSRPFRCVRKGCKRLAQYRPHDGGTVPLYCDEHRPKDVMTEEISPMKKSTRGMFLENIHMGEFFNRQEPLQFAFGDRKFNPYHYVVREIGPTLDKNENLRRDWSRVKELTAELRRLKGHQQWPDALTVTSLCMVQILTKIRSFLADRFVLSREMIGFVFRLLSVRIDVELEHVSEDSPYRSAVESMLAALFGITMNTDLVDLFSVYAQTIATHLVNERRVFYFLQIAGKVPKRKKTAAFEEGDDDEIYGSEEEDGEENQRDNIDEDLDAAEIDYGDDE